MWPLFCNEVGLSYDQEERVRTFQKEVISNQESWLHRHVSYASQHIIENLHDSILGSCEMVKKRDQDVMSVLTYEQKMKFLVWKMKKMKQYKIQHDDGSEKGDGSSSNSSSSNSNGSATLAVFLDKLSQSFKKSLNLGEGEENTSGDTGVVSPMSSLPNGNSMQMESCPLQAVATSSVSTSTTASSETLEVNPNNHDATNLYILNHKLTSTIKSSFPVIRPHSSNPLVLKRLSRRPSFESLAAVGEVNESGQGGGGKKGGKKDSMTRATSSGSLKRCSSEMSFDENGLINSMMMRKSDSGHSLASSSAVVSTLTPEAAQAASSHVITSALGPVRSLIPTMQVHQQAPAEKVDTIHTRPRSNTIAATNMIQAHPQTHSNCSTVQGLRSNVYQNKNQHQQIQYQPAPVQSSIAVSGSPLGQIDTVSYDQYPQTSTMSTVTTQNQVPYMSNATPNTVGSSHVQFEGQASAEQYSTAYNMSTDATTSASTTNAYVPSHHQQQNSYSFGAVTHQTNERESIKAQYSSNPLILQTTTSPVPSPLDANFISNTQQNQNHQVDADIDMMVVDTILQQYDAGGGGSSFYNVSNEAADDSLFELTEEDWTIGEGAFLDA